MRKTILPALIPKTWDDIVSFAELLSGVASMVQIDITDGICVSNVSWPYTDSGEVSVEELAHKSLPHSDSVQYQFDLMIAQPTPSVAAFVRMGVSGLVLHESDSSLATLAALQEKRLGEHPITLGIALPCNAEPAQFEPYKELVDFVQIMGISEVGFQGHSFEPVTAHTVAEFHAAYPDLLLQVDGGVGHEQLQTLAEAGATNLVMGSAILNASEPKDALHELLQELAQING